MPVTTLNGIDLYYETHGTGTPLVLIAGLASDSQSWLPVLEPLSRHHRVIIFDNRGAGRTVPQEAGPSIRQMADDCVALIAHLGLPSANLLGHSMGGFIALDCAIRYPGQVQNLVLSATSAFNTERNNALFLDWVSYLESGMDLRCWFRNIFYWIFSRRFFENGETLDAALRFAVEYPYPQSKTAFRNQVNAIREFNCLEGLAGINARTMILCGKEDILFTPEESMEVLKAIPGSVFSVIENAAHSIHMENPETFTDQVLRFLGNR